ncbi:MAG: hypothetical protein HKO87_08780 [Acidimicrobiia bacterium]|nr:hypothetical protein [Acidimicrobiia bacterium]
MDFTSYQAEAERFSTVRKGLDAEEVAAFQARAARSLRTYERELNLASQRIRELEGKVATIDGRVAQSELAFLHAADARQDLLAKARREADRIGEEAEQLRAEAAQFRDRLAGDRRHALEMTEAQRTALLAEAQSRLDQAEIVKNEADQAAAEILVAGRRTLEDERGRRLEGVAAREHELEQREASLVQDLAAAGAKADADRRRLVEAAAADAEAAVAAAHREARSILSSALEESSNVGQRLAAESAAMQSEIDRRLSSTHEEAERVIRAASEDAAALLDAAKATAAGTHEEIASRRAEVEDELGGTRARAEQEAATIVAEARERAESLAFAARGRAIEDEIAASRERDTATADGDELLAASRAIALAVMEDAKGQSDQMLEAAALQMAATEDEATRRWAQLEAERAGEIRALESRLDALRAVISDTESRFRSVTASSLQELATVGETTARPPGEMAEQPAETAEPDVPVVVELEGPDIIIDLTADAATPPPDALFDRRAAKSISAPDETDDDESLSRDIDEARRRPGFYQRRLAGLRERIERYDD